MKFQTLVGGLLAAMALGAHAADYPTNYVKCVQNTGATCSMTGTRQTALGKNDVFVYATRTGNFICSSSNFPSNTFPTSAWCSYSKTVSSSSSSVSSSVSSSASSSVSSSVSSSASSSVSSSVSSSSSSTTGSAACVGGASFTNTTVDCGGKTIGTSCSGDGEGQAPVITLNNASIKNVRISAAAADGIHCKSGNCLLENVVWDDVCEDAASNLTEGGTLTIRGGSAREAKDKVFQHNSKNSTTIIENFAVTNMGKLWRSCGDCTNNGGPRFVKINNVTVYGKVGDTIASGNQNYGDKITIRNLKVQGYVAPKPTSSNPNQSSPKICVENIGVQKGSGSSKSLGQSWNTAVCDVSRTDVTAF